MVLRKHFLIAGLWFALNLLFLTSYPFVHTDEPWLSGLTRTMMEEKSLNATEDFFDLYPRHPHAVKILYHIFQIPFIALFGYSVFSVRLLSLTAGSASLVLMGRLLDNLFPEGKKRFNMAILILMSADVQFIYASHFARQEAILLMLLLSALNAVAAERLSPRKRGLLAGLFIGLAAGFHPNAFIIAWPVGLYILYRMVAKKTAPSEGWSFLAVTGALALLFAGLSYLFNPGFIHDYGAYGEPLGVLASPDVKVLRLPGFFEKLFSRTGGTYHTPPIMVQMTLFPFWLVIDGVRNRNFLNIAGFLGFSVAVTIIGKFSQPSIVFLLPFYYLAIAGSLHGFMPAKWLFPAVLTFLFCGNLFFSVTDIRPEKESFAMWLHRMNEIIPENSVVLGNLYTEYLTGFNGRFHDWRNLSFLDVKDLSLKEYIDQRGIEYIILTDELDYIYENRPQWNALYGNTSNWYPQMKDFIARHTVPAGEISGSPYAVRIAPYRHLMDWKIRIYKVLQNESIME